MTRCTSALRPRGARNTIRAVLLLAALAAPAALADARADAKRHFREGMSLIAAGQVERGIAELKLAYDIKPHPDVLYDIARAYVDLGNIPEALGYFRQYVATNPADKDQVQRMISRLEAAIGSAAPATPPPQPGDMEKLMAQMRELIEKAQQPPATGAKPAVAKMEQPQTPKPHAHPDEDMFEEQTISPRAAPTSAR